MLIISIVSVNLALILYTVPTLNLLKKKTLLKWHVIMFCLGVIFDILGTFFMYKLGGSKLTGGLHGILGDTALLLMMINAISSVFLLNKKDKNETSQFYKFSLIVWVIWLISYVLGLFSHM